MYKLDRPVRVSEHLTLHSGAWIDAFAVCHGPLLYRGVQLSAAGGVHYNGCAFRCDGTNRDADPDAFYDEICIARECTSSGTPAAAADAQH